MLHPQCVFMQYERFFFISKVKNYAASKFAFLCIPGVQSDNLCTVYILQITNNLFRCLSKSS